MQATLLKYLKSFKKLRIDRSHGIAPHKPILLLSVLQLYQNGINKINKIYLTPELVGLFKSNWNLLVTTKHDCRISYPFYHLKSDKFWKLIPKDGFQNIDSLGSMVKSLNNLNSAIAFAMLEEDLFTLAIDPTDNKILQDYLLDEYFASTKINFRNSVDMQQKMIFEIEDKILNEPPQEYIEEIKVLLAQKDEEEIFLRGGLFKREIPKIYNNTCCISGMRIDATFNVSMVYACHIVPFSESYDDTISNGIALCPNLHRAFDRGLIGIDDKYRVIISKTFNEDPSIYSIKTFEKKEIILPKSSHYLPKKNNFQWHFEHVFKK